MKPVLLVTGATGGVGASLCEHLLPRFHVLAVGRQRPLLEALQRRLPGLTTFVADLADPRVVDDVLERVLLAHPYVPYLVNNAGVSRPATVVALEPRLAEESLQVNALAPLRFMQRLLPAMVERGFGRIVNVTSGAPLNCFAAHAAYSASKAALNAFTVTAAREHESNDIRINLMSPGPVRSGMAPDAPMDPSVCHPTLDWLLGLPPGGPTGRFFWLGRELPLRPDLDGVQWLQGTASERFPRVLP